MLSWIKKRLGVGNTTTQGDAPVIIGRSQHTVSRTHISNNALSVLARLTDAGYDAYLVGGGVRDLMLGLRPKDFDIATSARPEEIRRLFRNCRLIGRRFRLAHIHFGREIIEVATFRGGHEGKGESGVSDTGMILRDNVYGTLMEDAWRRDFRINALYHDARDYTLVDYTGGMADLQARRLQIIGDPEERFREDPVRMLRAVRFAAKLGFAIEPRCEEVIIRLGHLMDDVASARLFDEASKVFLSGHAVASLELMERYRFLGSLYPTTAESLGRSNEDRPFIEQAMVNSDARVAAHRAVNPSFLLAVMLWGSVRRMADKSGLAGGGYLQAIQVAGDKLLAEQQRHSSGPKRFSLQASEIWVMQERLIQRRGGQAYRLVEHPRFRAAYDFLLLRAESGEHELEALAEWWTRFQEVGAEQRTAMVAALDGGKKRKPRRRRKKSTPIEGD